MIIEDSILMNLGDVSAILKVFFQNLALRKETNQAKSPGQAETFGFAN